MSDALDAARAELSLHVERAHGELADENARLAALLDAACTENATLRALLEEHLQSYHPAEPEPAPEPAPEPEPEPAAEPEPEPEPAPDEPPAPSHWAVRRLGGHD